MDEKIDILIQHGGNWDGEHKYVNFDVDALLIDKDCTFTSFMADISKLFGVETSDNIVEIKYVLRENYPAMRIYSEMSLRVYMQLKLKNSKMTDYPICVSIKEMIQAGSFPKQNCFQSTDTQNVMVVSHPDTIQLIENTEVEDCVVMHPDEERIINNPLHVEVCEGQLYKDKTVLVNVMKHLAIKTKFQFMVPRSNKERYYLKCVDERCSWSFKSSTLHKSNIFKVRKFNNVHTCRNESRFFGQRNATADLIGSLVKFKLDDPKTIYTPADIRRDMKKDYGVEMNYMQAWRSKGKAIELLRGKPGDSYKKLPSYLYTVKRTNPGSIGQMEKSSDGCFLYAYVSIYASIKGWEYCMPIVVVDGGFLTSTNRGTLLTASTLDAAGSIFPLAYAVVDSENDASWEWFFEKIKETFGTREGMCIVSDRHESILRATSVVYPEVFHCVCMFHLWNNIKTRFKKTQAKLSGLYFAAARAYTIEEFDEHMSEIANIDKGVKEYLFKIGYERWCRAHSLVNRPMVMTSNIAESINSANKDARDMPIYHLLDYMMSLITDWHFNNRNKAMATYTELGEDYEEQLTENFAASTRMIVRSSTDYLHKVLDGETWYVVSMRERTCTCRRFQMDGLPCPHALAIVTKYNMDEYKYCSSYHTIENLKKTYEVPVYPIPDESIWAVPAYILEEIVLPPRGRRKSGRPKKTRHISFWESNHKKAKTACGLCGQLGHNRKTGRNPAKIA